MRWSENTGIVAEEKWVFGLSAMTAPHKVTLIKERGFMGGWLLRRNSKCLRGVLW